MNRLPDWQLRLDGFVRARAHQPFAWGSNDCATFAADCVEALTGARLLPELRSYATALQAMRLIEERGGLRGVATEALGEPIRPAFAAIGDVVLVSSAAGGEALGICNGSVVLGPGADGMEVIGMDAAIAAWRV